MKTIKFYHDLNLKCGILILADVFEKFRNDNLKTIIWIAMDYIQVAFKAHSLKLAMLNMTKVELELIPDPDTYIFFKKKYERWSFLYL